MEDTEQMEPACDTEVRCKDITLVDARAFIKANIATAASSFIAIGYYLKRVRDGKLYEVAYDSLWDFAMEEFGISKSTASRYMAINDKFSEGGDSPVTKAEYREFNKSQLQEMLCLSDEQIERVTPADTVGDIRSLRRQKEIPYMELPGQMEFESDFPNVFPDIEPDIEPEVPERMREKVLEINMGIDELAELTELTEHGPKQPEAVAISQFSRYRETGVTVTAQISLHFTTYGELELLLRRGLRFEAMEAARNLIDDIMQCGDTSQMILECYDCCLVKEDRL